jgi:hypothetical protein
VRAARPAPLPKNRALPVLAKRSVSPLPRTVARNPWPPTPAQSASPPLGPSHAPVTAPGPIATAIAPSPVVVLGDADDLVPVAQTESTHSESALAPTFDARPAPRIVEAPAERSPLAVSIEGRDPLLDEIPGLRRRRGRMVFLGLVLAVAAVAIAHRRGYLHVPVEQARPWGEAVLAMADPALERAVNFLGLDTPAVGAPVPFEQAEPPYQPNPFAPTTRHPLTPWNDPGSPSPDPAPTR